MRKAAKGGMMEVAMGRLAAQNVKLPSKEPTEKWSSDKPYMDMMVKDHEKDLAEFKEEANTGTDSDVKKFAEDTAKVVQEHLDLAKATQSKLQ